MKIIKIIIVNLFLILFLFLLSDWFLLATELYRPFWLDSSDKEWAIPRPENDIPFDENKKSVITAGCSFTYGMNLAPEDTFAYKIQQNTGRKTYNKGIPGFGPQQLLWQLQNDDFFNNKEIIEPEYYIYTFISDHIRRMYTNYFALSAYDDTYITGLYKVKNNKLIPRKKDVITVGDYIKLTKLAKMFNFIIYRYFTTDDQKFDLLKLYLTEIKNELQKRYPNIKPVIVIYNLNCDTNNQNKTVPFITNRWNELEKEGFIVIHFDTPDFDYLYTQEFLSGDNIHPSERAWESLTPIIIEKLNL